MSDETKIDYDAIERQLLPYANKRLPNTTIEISDLLASIREARSLHTADATVNREAVRQALGNYNHVKAALTAERERVVNLERSLQLAYRKEAEARDLIERAFTLQTDALAQTQGKECSEPDCHNPATVGDVCGLHPKSGALSPEFYDKTQGKEGEKRCEVCGWPLAESMEKGCIEGNCSYRPEPNSDEWRRIQNRRHELQKDALEPPTATVSSDGGRAVTLTPEQFLAAFDTCLLERNRHGYGEHNKAGLIRKLEDILIDSRIGGGK